MEQKKCCMCKKNKDLNEFYFYEKRQEYNSRCKECEKKYQIDYRNKNIEILKQKSKEYYIKKRKEKIEYEKQYYQTHKQQKREYDILYKKKAKNKRNNNENYLYANNQMYMFKKKARNLISKSFIRKKFTKNGRTQEIIGCDYEMFMKHLLQTFKDNYGYEWDKIEPVHIDHKIPLATAKTEEDVIKLCHYSNLQLLKAQDNLDKRDKLNWSLGGN